MSEGIVHVPIIGGRYFVQHYGEPLFQFQLYVTATVYNIYDSVRCIYLVWIYAGGRNQRRQSQK